MKFSLIICLLFLSLFFPQNGFAEDHVVINEFVAHPETGNNEWVEIYNPEKVDLSHYWIDDDTSFSDDSGGSSKKQLTTITNSIYAVFDLPSSMFNNDGDMVVLFDPSGTIIDQYTYDKDPGVDVSIGKYPDATGTLQTLMSTTKGDINSGPQLPPSATPTKIPTPTRVPTPTHTPTPSKVPTATSIPTSKPNATSTKIPTLSVSKPTLFQVQKSIAPTRQASSAAMPTSILAASISADPTKTLKKRTDVLVKDIARKNAFSTIPIIIGGLFLLSCGILIYLRARKKLLE